MIDEGQIIEEYLNKYGWHFRRHSDSAWLTGWKGEQRSFPLRITLDEVWLTYQVAPFIANPGEQPFSYDFVMFLLQLNDDLQLAKLSLDQYGSVVLSVQILCSNLRYDEFASALGILGHYAEKLYADILLHLARIPVPYLQNPLLIS